MKSEEIKATTLEEEEYIEISGTYSLEESFVLKNKGNEFFKAKQYLPAMQEYSQALQLAPLEEKEHRAILLCNRAACKWELQLVDECIADCTSSLELNDQYSKAYSRRFRALEKIDKLEESLADLNRLLELDTANHSLWEKEKSRVADLLAVKNEKLKDEVLGQLKDLGNSFLGKFGFSLDNFKTEKDPTTGAYSMSFKQ